MPDCGALRRYGAGVTQCFVEQDMRAARLSLGVLKTFQRISIGCFLATGVN